MNDVDAKEAQLLNGVRRAWSPEPSDQARILASLNAAVLISAPPVPAAVSPIAASRYFIGVLALGVAGLAGYGWGYRVGSAARVAPAVAGAGRVATPAAVSPVVAEPLAVAPSPVPVVAPVPPAVARPSSLPLPRAASSAAPEAAPAGLDEEVRQLRRIERALRSGNPRLALVLSEELDRELPNGQLLVERRAAALMAGCQLDPEGWAESARQFLAGSPDSPYAPRVREICGRVQRIAPAAGTDGGNPGGTK